MQKSFEKQKKMLAAGLALSIGSISLSTFQASAEAAKKPVTTTTTVEPSVEGLYVGAKLNIEKIISPINGIKRIDSASFSTKPDSDNTGEDLVVFYSPALSRDLIKAGNYKTKDISLGILFTDGGKKTGVVEGLVAFNTDTLVVRAFGPHHRIKTGWQPMYSQSPMVDNLDFVATDRALNVHNHRGVEILIQNITPMIPVQPA